jgi:hypothetical protein
MKTYKFYSDPAHAWLAVKRKELIELGLENPISSYSYQRGDTVYLEEDQDATLFINTLKSLGKKPHEDFHVQGNNYREKLGSSLL